MIAAPLKIQLPPTQKMPTGIYESLLLKNEAYKKSMDEEVKKMGKKASLRYKATQDGHSSEVFQEKCFRQKKTIVLVQTNHNSVVGGYCPDQWEDTTGEKCSDGDSDRKDIV